MIDDKRESKEFVLLAHYDDDDDCFAPRILLKHKIFVCIYFTLVAKHGQMVILVGNELDKPSSNIHFFSL